MAASSAQAWVGIIGGLLTALVGLLQYFRYQSRRDRMASVGAAFAATMESLTSDDDIERMAAAVLLRRFLDRKTEQGGRRRPYKKETVEVIAGILRYQQADNGDPIYQKALADGLRYARKLGSADLQRCNLRDAYLGRKPGDKWRLNLSNSDLFGADCASASFREVIANNAVFYEATLEKAVFIDAALRRADFREARLKGAKFRGAKIEGARFAGAHDIPREVSELLNDNFVGVPGAKVRGEDGGW